MEETTHTRRMIIIMVVFIAMVIAIFICPFSRVDGFEGSSLGRTYGVWTVGATGKDD